MEVKRRHITVAGKKFITISVIVMFMIIGALASYVLTDSSKETVGDRYYSSMTIRDKDTLWDIANKYHGEGESCSDYVKNILAMNNMSNDKLYSGMNITYYYFGDK